MSNKTCGNCRFYNSDYNLCLHWRHEDINEHSPICNYFKPLTNGDVIRHEEDRDFAEYFVYETGAMFASTLIVDKTFDTYEEAVKTTVDYLNAPAGKDNNVPAKESEVHDGFAKCEYCGKTYRKKKKAQRFCSIKCKDKWWNRERYADSEYLHPHCEDNFNGDW